jgi:hypothetical protein
VLLDGEEGENCIDHRISIPNGGWLLVRLAIVEKANSSQRPHILIAKLYLSHRAKRLSLRGGIPSHVPFANLGGYRT